MKTLEIPDFPKIKIKNFIVELPNEIKVILKNNVLKSQITNPILNKISKSLGYNVKSVKRYLINEQYPIKFVEELNNIINKDIFAIIENNIQYFISKWKKVILPRYITPKLSYFVGYLQGDGSIESNGKRINFCDEYLDQIRRINLMCNDLFNIDGRIEEKNSPISRKPAYRLEIGSLILNSYLNKVFNINKGIKTNLKIPKKFINNKEILKWYLIGLYDADGTLPKNHKRCKQFFIDITLKDKNFICQIKQVLLKFDVVTLKPYCRVAKSPDSDYISKTWELRIRKKKDLISFLKNIGFSHPDKKVRAEKLLLYMRQ